MIKKILIYIQIYKNCFVAKREQIFLTVILMSRKKRNSRASKNKAMYVVNLDMNLECAGFKDRFVNCLNKQKPKEPPPPKKTPNKSNKDFIVQLYCLQIYQRENEERKTSAKLLTLFEVTLGLALNVLVITRSMIVHRSPEPRRDIP